MRAGTLKHTVTIQRPGSRTAEGERAGWVTHLSPVRADILVQSGAEANRAEADVSIVKASIRIRYRAGITAAMRVLQGATVWEIKAVNPDERDRAYLELVCETGGTRG